MLRSMFFGFLVGTLASPYLADFAADGGASVLQKVQAVFHTEAYEQISRALSHA